MEFYAQNGKIRPVRLSYKTRKFAFESLNRKYGLDTLKNEAVKLDEIEGFESLSKIEQHDLAIKKIAKEAPIRICEGERICGAATLGLAIRHYIPATYNGKKIIYGVSHLTVDFEKVLKEGINSIKVCAERAYEKHKGTEKEAFSRSCLNCLEAFEIWHGRYLKELLDRGAEYRQNYENLIKVPFEPASSFYEAVQSLWFTFAFIRLCGNWPGIGRIDYLLGDYLKKDIDDGKITLDEAREILAHFFIKGCEWINGQLDCPFEGSGDAQHYQNILIGGIDECGNEVTNEVTYLVLDILEELGISDFPTSVRVNQSTSEKLLQRVAEVMRFGGGTLAVYNEDLVIEALKNDGYAEVEARRFANDGCWEVQIPGKTCFSYVPIDSLQILQKYTLKEYDGTASFDNFESLYKKYVDDLKIGIEQVFLNIRQKFKESNAFEWVERSPCTVVSLFEDGCIEKGASYHEGGPVYNLTSPHIGGLADTVNSLYAIKKLVFDEKKLSLAELLTILKNNWGGEEVLRQYALNRYAYFGNDNDEVDEIAARLLSDFADICLSFDGKCGYRFPAGVSTFGRQLEWSPKRLAAPHGRRSGEVLAANCSPTPNTDREGATAIIRSYCKIDHKKLATGAALDIKLLPSSVDGEDGLVALIALIRGFVSLGGFFMQPDVADVSVLKEAQKHPEDYQTLSVRVSGWNARFVTLNKEWQDMVIEQNER